MTVPSSVAKSGPYNCNGVTDVFNYDFRIVDKSHLKVMLTDAAGVETVIVLTTHYTVSDVGADVGSINLTSAGVALAVTGTKLTILRNPPFTQETDLQNQGAYLAQTVEDRFDLLTMQVQTVKERSDRSIAIPASDEGTTLEDLTADLIAVAAIAPAVSTVAANDANVTIIAGVSADVTTVAGIAANVSTVAARDADIGTVADRDADIGTVAGIASEVGTVAGIAGDVSTVAGIAADVTTVAGIAVDVATVADNVTDITNFSDVYLGPKAADPTTRNDGSALHAGDLYFNTATDLQMFYNGSAWVGGALTGGTTGLAVLAADDLAEAFTALGTPLTANTMLVDNAAGTAREAMTFEEVRTLLGIEDGVPYLPPLQNYVPNGNFEFWRLAWSQSVSGRNSDDEWDNSFSGNTVLHSVGSFVPGQAAVPGNPHLFSSTTVTMVAGVSNYSFKSVRLGRVADLAGKTVTVTVWAKADAGKNMAVGLESFYGTGGTPSAADITAQTVALTTGWAKKSFAVTLPSLAGKTLGSNENDAYTLIFWFSAGSNFNVRTNSLGQQSGVFDIARVSVLPGDHTSIADPWDRFGRTDPGYISGGRYRGGMINIPINYEFYRNPGTPMPTLGTANWYYPGAALSASSISFDLKYRKKLVSAIWHLIWTPNSPTIGTGVRLVKADGGPTNIDQIAMIGPTIGVSPLNGSADITAEMHKFFNDRSNINGVKQIIQQFYGDGTNGPLVYASWIECIWDVSPD